MVLEGSGRQSVSAVIILSDVGRSTLDELGRGQFWILLRKTLRLSVEPVGIPRRYRVVEQIPVNSQGKHNVPVLEALFVDQSPANRDVKKEF